MQYVSGQEKEALKRMRLGDGEINLTQILRRRRCRRVGVGLLNGAFWAFVGFVRPPPRRGEVFFEERRVRFPELEHQIVPLIPLNHHG